MKKPQIFLIATLFLFLCCKSFLNSQSKADQIREVMDDFISPEAPGFAVIATQGEEVLFREAFGLSNVSNSEKLNADHLFRIGSITKQYTAVAILKLAQEKKLELDDRIEKFIPGTSMVREITIRQLLSHTSGLGNQSDIPSFEEKFNAENYPEGIITAILNSPLKFDSGEDYAYSNLGYILLGYIIEIVSEKSYENYLKTNLLQPLHLDHTGFEYIDDFTPLMSKGHSLSAGKHEFAAPLNMKTPFSAGGLTSSLDDLVSWNRSIRQGKILPKSYIDQISESSILPNGKSTGYSMGWQIGEIQGYKSIKHDGIVNGYTSISIYIPEKDIFVTLLSNCDCYNNIEIPASKITAIMLDNPYPTDGIPLPKIALEKFQGKFQNDSREMIIALNDEALMYYPRGGSKSILMPISDSKFLISNSLNQIEFSKDKKGDISFSLTSLSVSSKWQKVDSMRAFYKMEVDSIQLEEYVGKYQVPGQFILEIVSVKNKLYGQVGNDRKELFCYDADHFCARNSDIVLNFKRGANNEIKAVVLKQGMEVSASRL